MVDTNAKTEGNGQGPSQEQKHVKDVKIVNKTFSSGPSVKELQAAYQSGKSSDKPTLGIKISLAASPSMSPSGSVLGTGSPALREVASERTAKMEKDKEVTKHLPLTKSKESESTHDINVGWTGTNRNPATSSIGAPCDPVLPETIGSASSTATFKSIDDDVDLISFSEESRKPVSDSGKCDEPTPMEVDEPSPERSMPNVQDEDQPNKPQPDRRQAAKILSNNDMQEFKPQQQSAEILYYNETKSTSHRPIRNMDEQQRYRTSSGQTSHHEHRQRDHSEDTIITFTPIYTKVSEKPHASLYKAIFFHRNAPLSFDPSPVTLDFGKWKTTSQSTVRSPFYTEARWKGVVTELGILKETCKSAIFTDQPHLIGKRFSETVRSYCKEAYDSDFKILSGSNISEHVLSKLPIIIDQALLLPSLLSKQIPILEAGKSGTLLVTKKLCCSLLANAFFSTFPKPRSDMPDINFHRLFNRGLVEGKNKVKTEKVMCILNYFHHMTNKINQKEFGDHIISYERRHLTQFPKWAESKKPMIKVGVEPDKKIEEEHDMLQIDFANKVVGGGVLNEGSIMEEILFVICPELILARLFTPPLEDTEVLVITGAHQFSKYEGYASTFVFDEPYVFTDTGADSLGRLHTQVVAMDALHFTGDPKKQFRTEFIDRELRKCFVGFYRGADAPNNPVATGNWGCGAFHGDTELKFLIQWISATVAERPALHYHTVGSREQAKSIRATVDFLHHQKADAGKLYKLITSFYEVRYDYGSIFQFIEHKLSRRKFL